MIPSSRRLVASRRGAAVNAGRRLRLSSTSSSNGGGSIFRRATRNGRCRAAVAGNGVLRRSLLLRQSALYYSTERVVELRSGKKASDQPKTLYDPSNESENCGVGLIASLKSVPSRDIVVKADEMLVRMSHRGGCGCDPKSGDGSGMREDNLVEFSLPCLCVVLSSGRLSQKIVL